ncbi:hypothetical protein CABS03_06727, partial [Colletotrichum abscissum]
FPRTQVSRLQLQPVIVYCRLRLHLTSPHSSGHSSHPSVAPRPDHHHLSAPSFRPNSKPKRATPSCHLLVPCTSRLTFASSFFFFLLSIPADRTCSTLPQEGTTPRQVFLCLVSHICSTDDNDNSTSIGLDIRLSAFTVASRARPQASYCKEVCAYLTQRSAGAGAAAQRYSRRQKASIWDRLTTINSSFV